MTYPLFYKVTKCGYDTETSRKYAGLTQLFQNVGDNMSQQTASQDMVSMQKAFGLDAKGMQHAIDGVNEVKLLVASLSRRI